MFHHSVRVPRLYKIAAKIAKDVKEGAGSIKQLVYENQKKHPRINSLYALVATLFQRSDEIENLLKRSKFLIKEPRSDPWLIKVLIVELLWGKKRLSGESKPEKAVLAYEQIFKAHLNDVSSAPQENDSNKAETKPRYVRVNTLSVSLNEAVDRFRDEGWDFCKFLDKKNYKEFLNKISSLAEYEFLVDIHIPNLLIFPPKTKFYYHPAYKNGSIILQDKASCLPVHILGPQPGSVVLDMCAAPGMKTTQVAAAINNEGTVYAVERDPRRFETLNRIIDSSGATCVKTVNKDVLTCDGKEFPGVEYILVDPSCTGSGMTDRLQSEQEESQNRMQKITGFQIKILRSALTRYPAAKRVVYSTCSVFPEENEDVVRQVLETNTSFKLVPAKQFVNDTWQNFGSSDFGDIGKHCLYAKPNEDLTNGFFVAVFERLEKGEENAFFNTKIFNFKKHIQSQEKRRNKKQQEYQNFETTLAENGEGFEGDMQQYQEYAFGEANDNARLEDTVDSGTTGSRKKKKGKSKNEFTANDDSARVQSNSNDIQEKNSETGIEIDDNEVVCKKKKKRKPVETEYSFDKIENIVEGKHKKKKRKESQSEGFEDCYEENLESVKHKKKKNKKSHIECVETVIESNKEVNAESVELSALDTRHISKKTKRSIDLHFGELDRIGEGDVTFKKKKKKHRRNRETESIANDSIEVVDKNVSTTEIRISKKKKKHEEAQIVNMEAVSGSGEPATIKKKKKKSKTENIENTDCNVSGLETNK